MSELPKIVRERLKAAPAGAHPDADQLTALAEKRLGERERALVLAHLSACSACREVVALALPEEEAEQAAIAPQPARWWGLRWQTAAALATVAVAAVALLTIPNSYFRSTPRTTQVSQAPAPAAKSAATRHEESVPATSEVRSVNGKLEAKAAPAPAAGKKEAEAQGGAAGKVSAELAKAQTGREQELSDKLARNLPSPAKKDKEVSALAPPAQPGAAPAANQYDFKTAQAAPPVAADQATAEKQQPSAGGIVGPSGVAQKAPAAAPQAKVTGQAPARAANETVQVVLETSTVAQASEWRTTAGKLQHSTDSGKSWRTVNVATGAVLNAVSEVGDHVWAGGHQRRTAILYYSADGGAHWARLDFTAPAGAQASDVVALSFSDAQRGVMTVVAAEDPRLRVIWTTADGGRTWTAPAPH